jgi:hypothetical protein
LAKAPLPLHFFSILLAANIAFFMIIKSEFPEIYENVFDQMANWLKGTGFAVTGQEIHAICVLTGFIVVSVSAASLLFLTLGIFRMKPSRQT